MPCYGGSLWIKNKEQKCKTTRLPIIKVETHLLPSVAEV